VWFDDPKRPYKRAHKTQIQELLGYFLGPWGTRAIYVMMFMMWFGLGVAQILASSTNYYSINPTYSLRCGSLPGIVALWQRC